MKLKDLLPILIVFIFYNTNVKAQIYHTKPENFFGIQVEPLIPLGIVGDKSFDMVESDFETTVSPLTGYSYGGVVRIGLTELLAIETGISYTKRNYKVSYIISDPSVSAQSEVSFVSFDIPLNLLVYIKLGKQLYMNVGIGASVNYNPSNIFSVINPEEEHLFIFKGKRSNYFDFNSNADVGVEYRTQNSGTLYLGISGHVPFSPILEITSVYRNGTYETLTKGEIKGSAFAFNLKYFFHNQVRKKGTQFNRGPIEQ